MLAHDGIVFSERHLFGDVARVFLGHIEKAGVSGADELDLDRGWLRHGPFLQFVISLKTEGAQAPLRSQTQTNAGLAAESQELSREKAALGTVPAWGTVPLVVGVGK